MVPLTLISIDFTQGVATSLIDDDLNALEDVFDYVERSKGEVIHGDVALLYLNFSEAGSVVGSNLTIHDIVSRCGALIVVIATENDSMGVSAALGNLGDCTVNLIVTRNRKESSFSRFLRNVFDTMATGVPMAVAWNQWAPQMPPQYIPKDLPTVPETICIMKIAGLKFPAGEA